MRKNVILVRRSTVALRSCNLSEELAGKLFRYMDKSSLKELCNVSNKWMNLSFCNEKKNRDKNTMNTSQSSLQVLQSSCLVKTNAKALKKFSWIPRSMLKFNNMIRVFDTFWNLKCTVEILVFCWRNICHCQFSLRQHSQCSSQQYGFLGCMNIAGLVWNRSAGEN